MNINLVSKKITLPIAILGVLLLIAYVTAKVPPQAERQPPSNNAAMTVETMTIAASPYTIQLQSYGTVKPRTRSMLVSQTSGQVVWVSPQYRDGGIFKTGDPLVRIDKRDYEADVKVAEATLLDAQQALAREQALSVQALEDWERLGNPGEAPDLVLRKPQLIAAKARVISGEASLTKSQLSLERTNIVAPFDGRILAKQIDVGQVVANNSQLAEIYANDYLEIRLPLRNSDLAYIDLPGDITGSAENVATVKIQSSLRKQHKWDAQLIRTESAIDESSQQLHVIAQIDKPFDNSGHKDPLKIGEYVTAEIAGILIDEAIVIPNKTIYQGSYVYIVENGVLMRRDINIAWQNDNVAIIDAGLMPHEFLVTTPLGQITSGTRVNTISAVPQENIAQPSVIESSNETTENNINTSDQNMDKST